MAYYRVLMLHGTVIIDTTMVATCIERTLATFIMDYERKPYTVTGCGLVVGAVGRFGVPLANSVPLLGHPSIAKSRKFHVHKSARPLLVITLSGRGLAS